MTRWLALACVAVFACSREPEPAREAPASAPSESTSQTAAANESESEGETGAESETGDARSGEQAHVITFADRTSMGYLLLLPAGNEQPDPPTRERLATLVQQAFPDRRSDGEIDLLLTLIATEPHTTELGFDLQPPSLDDEPAETTTAAPPMVEIGEGELAEQMAKRERQRIFDLIGLHIEIIRLGVGDDVIPGDALTDPVLTRGLDSAERDSLPGRGWALLLRADYRCQHGVRGLRLLQTLVRVVAEHEGALIHDPDTLETMNLATFEQRRLRVNAGNVADQLAIVPFDDPRHPGKLRMVTRGMRRFGAVDVELDGLPTDPAVLQRASDLLAGLALVLTREGEVDVTGFAVQVPDELEVEFDDVVSAYGSRSAPLRRCAECPARAVLHLVERPADDTDPEDHVVARVVAPREQSDEADYDHPQWALGALADLFGPAAAATPSVPADSP